MKAWFVFNPRGTICICKNKGVCMAVVTALGWAGKDVQYEERAIPLGVM